MINSGRLRQRVIVQVSGGVSDGAGGTTKTWADAFTIRAEVIPLSGGEAFRQGMANATQFYRVTCRHRTNVSPANRLMWNDQALNIRTCADPDGRREALVMTAESGAPEP